MHTKVQKTKATHSTKAAKSTGTAKVFPKLSTTTPGDSYEREADNMADLLVRHMHSPQHISTGLPKVARRPNGSGTGLAIDSGMENQLRSPRGGHGLPPSLQRPMEHGLQSDLSQVRLHTDEQAAQLSQAIHAKAFTYGNHIYFNSGQYQPQSTAGQHLIAHELTHVVQGGDFVGREGEKDNMQDKEIDPKTGFNDIISYLSLVISIKDTNEFFQKIKGISKQLLAGIKEYHKHYKAPKLAPRMTPTRYLQIFGKSFNFALWLAASIQAAVVSTKTIQQYYANKHPHISETIGLVYYILRALSTIAECPFIPYPPTARGLLMTFNTSSSIGDLYSERGAKHFKTVADYYGGPDSKLALFLGAIASTPLGEIGPAIGWAKIKFFE